MVGAKGFEPSTLWSQTRCATRLRYAPIKKLTEKTKAHYIQNLYKCQDFSMKK